MGNQERDAMQLHTLKQLGWSVLTIWECELRREDLVRDRLDSFVR